MKMSDYHIIIESDSDNNTSSSKRGIEFESHSLSSANGDFKQEIDSLVDNLEMKGVCGDSLSN